MAYCRHLDEYGRRSVLVWSFPSDNSGLAYLTERWAARLVGELFRNFTVCFVGYSINDPVLRYMNRRHWLPTVCFLGEIATGGVRASEALP
jgi:hypothetical protein